MEAIRKQATKLREQVAKQQQAHIPLLLWKIYILITILNLLYKYTCYYS